MPTVEIFLLVILLSGKLLFVSGIECVEPGVTCSEDCSHVLLCVDVGGEIITVVSETCDSGSLCDVVAHKCVPESQSSCSVPVTCLKPGLMCNDDCSQVIFCSYVGGELQGIVTQQCNDNLFCDAISGTCVAEQNSTCYSKDFVFKCTSRGFYPDPFDCHKYYVCGKPPGDGTYMPEEGDSPSDPRNSCPSGYAYDYLSTICKNKQECADPVVPRCEKALETNVLLDNHSMYYICMKDATTNKLSPLLFRCPYGEYNHTIYTCV